MKSPGRLAATRNSEFTARLSLQVRTGYHVNSNAPADPNLIPLRLTWDPSPVKTAGVSYPKPEIVRYSFSPKPLSVFTGEFDVVTTFLVPPEVQLGPSTLTGKLRYQACDDSMCLPPKTLDVRLPVDIRAR